MNTSRIIHRVLMSLATQGIGGVMMVIFLAHFSLASCNAQVPQPCAGQDALPRLSTPLDSAKEASFDRMFPAVNAVTSSDLHSLMVVQHDTVLYERYATGHSADELHICWSATKTFTALAVGLAQADGLLDVHAPLLQYLPKNELPDTLTDPRWQTLTLHHVLSMCSGLEADNSTNRIRSGEQFCPLRAIAERGFRDAPGRKWRYNGADSYLAAVCVENVTGRTVDAYLGEKLFAPLGIRSWEWEHDAMGHCPGGFGLHLTTESLAKIGLLILHQGRWNEQQLVPADWIAQMTTIHAWQNATNQPLTKDEQATQYERKASDWHVGYGYQMWACRAPGAMRIDGMWGQYVVIMPDKDAVGVMTTLCTERAVQMDAFWLNVYEKL